MAQQFPLNQLLASRRGQPGGQQVAGGPQMFMPGDTVRVMDANGPYVGTVTGYDARGQALVASNPRNAWDAQPVDPAMLRRLDGPLSGPRTR